MPSLAVGPNLMNIIVKEELRAYIDPLTPEEHDALERSILSEGCRDALVLWGEVLVDGHNRYGICSKHNIPFQTVQNPRFQSMDDVHLWMIDQHLGRRSVSDFQRGVLALRKKEILTARSKPRSRQPRRRRPRPCRWKPKPLGGREADLGGCSPGHFARARSLGFARGHCPGGAHQQRHGQPD